MRRLVLIGGLSLAVALAAAACGGGGGGDEESSAGDIAAGKDLFAANCATCHGPEGAGGGNKTGPILKAKEFLADQSVEQMASKIEIGVPGTQMVAWGKVFGGPFTETQLNQVAAYLLSFQDTAPSVPNRRVIP